MLSLPALHTPELAEDVLPHPSAMVKFTKFEILRRALRVPQAMEHPARKRGDSNAAMGELNVAMICNPELQRGAKWLHRRAVLGMCVALHGTKGTSVAGDRAQQHTC